ncbi:hypothetical protein [Streptomyces sp. SP18BB07]|uniref:hypothetical protein n=1 Tax=Streptomyces sp. SP18BB07 TaxID=3002522 RepID=UPI002E7A68BC|nr:hypothetical protein [Streptomyces sp. SP18BB07]MEE1760851.1 hypothetical protein [Streptomyces sp. SP18BB07]
MAAGAMPVLAIPLFVMGVMPLTAEALYLVIPLALLTVALVLHGSTEAMWALKGLIAGVAGVAVYDTVRIPMVVAGIWPDFIPRLGAWVVGSDEDQPFVGYLWRYLGDGGGIGMAFFVFCRAVASFRPSLITARPALLSVGYGVFIWCGLLATVVLPPHGSDLLFALTPESFCLSLLGHLIYGTVLGLFLSRAVTDVLRPEVTAAFCDMAPAGKHKSPFASEA